MTTQIQVIENSDRFCVLENNVTVYTFLFGNGISKQFAQMNANSEAYKLAVRKNLEGADMILLPQQIK